MKNVNTKTNTTNVNRNYKEIKSVLEKAKKATTWETFLTTINTVPFVFCGVGDNATMNEKVLEIALLPPTKKTEKGYIKDLKIFKKFVHLFKNVYAYFLKRVEYSITYTPLTKSVFCPFGLNGEKSFSYYTFKNMLCNFYHKFDISDIVLYGAVKEKAPDKIHFFQWDKHNETDCKEYTEFLQENSIIDIDKRGFYCLRLRPTNTALEKLIFSSCYTTSLDYTIAKKVMDKQEQCSCMGEKFESLFYEKYTGKKWEKSEEKSFKYVPDVYINKKGYQLKFGRATLCRIGTLKNEL